MATVEFDFAAFTDGIKQPGILLVDFWSEWCGPCRQFGPIFEAASEANSDAVFAKVDTEANQELANALQITSIPTLMIFRDGINLYSRAGAMPGPDLDELIGAVRNLDMDDVRAQIAAEAAANTEEKEVKE